MAVRLGPELLQRKLAPAGVVLAVPLERVWGALTAPERQAEWRLGQDYFSNLLDRGLQVVAGPEPVAHHTLPLAQALPSRW
ncbi:MAG: hypothetical protein WA672_00420 [Candidatus Angelobacter sp.]